MRNGIAVSSKIDLIFSKSEVIKSSTTLDINVSDHQAVMVTMKKSYTTPTKINFTGRSYKNYIREDFQESLVGEEWREFYGSRDPEFLWETMEGLIRNNIDKVCPLKSYKVNEIREPWITNEAIEAIRDKDRMMKKAKKSGSSRDWDEAKRLRNEVGRNLRDLRANYLKQQQEAHGSDPKKFWKSVSSIIPDKKSKSAEIWLKDQSTDPSGNNRKVADLFNTFFTNIGPNLARNYSDRWEYYGKRSDDGIQPMVTDEEEIIKLCKDINIYKSSGIEGLSSRICKDAFLVLSQQMTHLFNCSLSESVFPGAWKIAVDLAILKYKLEELGIRGESLRWCSSYLTNRYQRTVANNLVSEKLPILCGVPQGSVLGPLFFLIYINDVLDVLGDCKIKLYADDTVIYHSDVNHNLAAARLQHNLSKFHKWCVENKLTINAKKTKLMVFGTRSRVKSAKNVKIKINNEEIQTVPSFKYLGILLDSTLNYNQHIASVIRTVLHKITLLSKVKRYLRDESALQIYKSMILPYLDYADVVFANSNAVDIEKLQRLQNRCLKVCTGRDRLFSTDILHKSTNVPFLKDRRKAHVRNFMYTRLTHKDLINTREIRTRAHDAPLFNVSIPRCEAYKRSVGYFGSVEWNNLPPATRNINPYLAFKYLQKKTMLDPLTLIQY